MLNAFTTISGTISIGCISNDSKLGLGAFSTPRLRMGFGAKAGVVAGRQPKRGQVERAGESKPAYSFWKTDVLPLTTLGDCMTAGRLILVSLP